jgi:outer membrane lipoprotein-sorting protein
MMHCLSSVRRITAAIVAAALTWAPAAMAQDASADALDRWLEKQAGIHTWSADVVQTRDLPSLARPLKTNGKVWFAVPNRFRWQLGDPARTVAVRTAEELLVVYPRLQQVERYAFSGDLDPAWKQVLALLEVGFPSDAATFHASYQVLNTESLDAAWRFHLRPASAAARRMLAAVRIQVAKADYRLMATELVFPDGSSMRTDFNHTRVDPPMDGDLFEFSSDWEGWSQVRPLEGRK